MKGARMKSAMQKGPSLSLGGGLVSNFLNRLTKGAVVDVFYPGPLSVNLADVLLIAGGGAILIQILTQAPSRNGEARP